MKVLFANRNSQKHNPFVKELINGFGGEIHITHGAAPFWEKSEDFDLVHLQWPEHLGEHNRLDILRFEEALAFWSRKAAIISTLHNFQPHDAVIRARYPDLYNLVYRYVDGVAHLGSFSRDHFLDYVPAANPKIQHRLIMHHVYHEDLTAISQEQGVTIGERAKILVFGKIRNAEERNALRPLLLKKPSNWDIEITNWRPKLGLSKKRYPIKWIKHWIGTFIDKAVFGSKIASQHLSFAESIRKFQQADLILIPRINTLNSGVVTQGIAHGKVVVGPDIGNIGPILKELGNPVFRPGDLSSMKKAISEGLDLAKDGLGKANQRYATTNLLPEDMAAEYLQFYKEVYTSKFK